MRAFVTTEAGKSWVEYSIETKANPRTPMNCNEVAKIFLCEAIGNDRFRYTVFSYDPRKTNFQFIKMDKSAAPDLLTYQGSCKLR